MTREHILVIRHGALGDIILSTAAFAAIRAHHPQAHITLLTTKPFAKLLAQSPYFDEVRIDQRAKWWKLGAWVEVIRFLRSQRWDVVYDLQTSSRSTLYFRFLRTPKPPFSGIAKGCAFEHNSLERTTSHTLDRQRDQLACAGITYEPQPDTTWMHGDGTRFALPEPYALIAAGGSAHRPEKRWHTLGFSQLCAHLLHCGITPVLLGTAAEKAVIHSITGQTPEINGNKIINLCEQTSFGDMVDLAKNATVAIGNDTGPMHIIAASGCPSVVLFSHASNPALCAPRGAHVRTHQVPDLQTLDAKEVIALVEGSTRHGSI